MKASLVPAGVLVAATLAAATQGPARPEPSLSIQPLTSPAGESSAQPQMTVSARGILLSWIERSGARASLRFAERSSTGWSEPRTVASGDDWFVNWADVPSVLRLDSGALVGHWLQKSGSDPYAYDVRLSYSTDDGRSWSPSFTPHHDGTRTEHGFASLFEMPGSGLGLIWLDGRSMAGEAPPQMAEKPDRSGSASPAAVSFGPASGGARRLEEPTAQGMPAFKTSNEGHDAHAADRGAMTIQFGSFDAQWKQTRETPVDVRVCECCPTTAAVTSDGPIVAYRDRSEDEVRDISVARFENGKWASPVPVYNDRWKIAACPVNGPMLSARGRDVVLAWFTVKTDVGHAYVAFSSDAGRTFGQPIRLDEASAIGRVDVVLLPDGSAAATWIESAGQRSTLALRRVQPSGQRSPLVAVSAIDGARASGYPRLAHHGSELLFAWTENQAGKPAVKTATASVPSR
jgi:hypothetical protein